MKNVRKLLLGLGTLFVTLALLVAFGASTAFAGTTPAIANIDHKNGVNRVLVEFNAPVWGNTTYTTGLAASDFQLGGTCGTGVTTISGVTHAAGDDWAVLTVNGTVNANMSTGSCTIAAVANNIFTVGGALSEKTFAWDATADTTAPTISAAAAVNGQAEVLVTFTEHVYGEADGTAALVNADLAYQDSGADGCTGTAAGTTAHTAGNNWAIWTCSVNFATVADIDDAGENMDLAGATSVYDIFGNAAIQAQNADITADAGVPTFATGFVATKAEATVGGTKILVKFSEPVFNAIAPTMAADLETTDFTYTNTSGAGAASISGIATTVDQKWALLTVNTALLVADLTNATADTVNAVATEIHDAFDQQQATTTMQLADNTDPTILSLAFNESTGANIFTITYSEKVTITGLTTGSATMAASTATVGDLAVAGALQGFGTFATAGNVTVPTTLNSLAIDSTQTIITVTIAGGTNGYMANASTTAPSGIFTPEITGAGIQDLRPSADTANDIETISTLSTLTTTTAWDLTKPTITAGVLTDAYINATTTSPGKDGKVDTLTLTASETLKAVADAADTRNDWTLASNPTEFGSSLTVTSASAAGSAATYIILFSDANIYYDLATFTATAAADEWSLMDRAGNIFAPTSKVCASGYVCTGGTGNYAVTTVSIEKPSTRDSSAPAKPTAVTAVMTDDGKVTLAWTDPTATDLSKINIYRAKNGAVVTGEVYATVVKGVKTYTDSDVVAGDIVEYILKALDTSNNASGVTDSVKITVTAPVVEEEAVVEEETPAEEEETTVEEATTEEETTVEEGATGEEEETPAPITVITTGGAEVTLTDVGTHWAKTKIEAMTEKNIVQGNPDGSFKPNSNLNRAEGAALLYRVLGLAEATAPALAPFSDVAKTSWYAGYVAKLKALAITKGNPDGTYKPSSNINRAEFLSLALRTYYYMGDATVKAEIDAFKAGTKTTKYADLKTAWYTPEVTAATELGFVSGSTCTGGKCFNAESSITRAEATTILYNMFFTLLE